MLYKCFVFTGILHRIEVMELMLLLKLLLHVYQTEIIIISDQIYINPYPADHDYCHF